MQKKCQTTEVKLLQQNSYKMPNLAYLTFAVPAGNPSDALNDPPVKKTTSVFGDLKLWDWYWCHHMTWVHTQYISAISHFLPQAKH